MIYYLNLSCFLFPYLQSPSFANFKMAVDLSRRSSFAGLEEIVASTMDDILEVC